MSDLELFRKHLEVERGLSPKTVLERGEMEEEHVHRKYDPNDIRRESQDPCPTCLAREAELKEAQAGLAAARQAVWSREARVEKLEGALGHIEAIWQHREEGYRNGSSLNVAEVDVELCGKIARQVLSEGE